MTARIALVTGANQGIGFALVEGPAARMGSDDLVLLTGRKAQRVADAASLVAKAPGTRSRVEGRVLDVAGAGAVARLAAELDERHGGLDRPGSGRCPRCASSRRRQPGWTYDSRVELLEREPLLVSLREFQAGSVGGGGCLVFVSGEAGIGKTALASSFCDGLAAGTAVHRGFCDSLGTPRALGPLHDIARAGLDGLAGLLAAGEDRHTLFTAFLDLLGAGPSVTLIEDAHWADEATLDLLLFVGRRVGGLPAMVVVTYRTEEVGRDHPLRRVLGDLATARSVRRLTVPALSEAAVTALAEPAGRDGAQLHRVTGGNPFFVTEALAASTQHVPGSVRDAVLARASRLGVAARAILDAVSLVPDRVEVALLESVVAADVTALDDGIESGMLVLEGTAVRFRHELARRAVEADVPAGRGSELHGRILTYLAAMGTVDPARLSYHADAAGDAAAVLRYAPVAARLASGLGAHREAAMHYGRALRHVAATSTAQLAELWECRADACERSYWASGGPGQLADAVEASARAVELWRAAGQVEREAVVMARRSHLLWVSGRSGEAQDTTRAAVALLEPLPPGPLQALAYTALAGSLMLACDIPGAISLGSTAISYAERYGDIDTLALALVVVGNAHWSTDPDRAVELLTSSLDAARRAENDLAVAAAMCSLVSGSGLIRRYDLADRWLGDAVAWCTERDLDSFRGYALACQARFRFEQGRWAEATAAVTAVIGAHSPHVPTQVVALTVLGRLRARRGDPDARAPLAAAWALAEQAGDLQLLWPAAAARAEAAWLAGVPAPIEALVADTFRLATRLEHGWAAGELGYWLWVAGAGAEPAGFAARPWALQICGDGKAAAELWRELGCPYEAAVALAEDDDPDNQLAALNELQGLGAWPAAELLARRLREHGLRRLPRRPRRTTRDNPAQLTDRQVDVLGLLAEGLRNTDIAAQLHISSKTVDHHVSAILAKLGVGSRQEAARWARLAPGDVPQDG
jgi:DNA-binding CsgD family transcriptional regulator